MSEVFSPGMLWNVMYFRNRNRNSGGQGGHGRKQLRGAIGCYDSVQRPWFLGQSWWIVVLLAFVSLIS